MLDTNLSDDEKAEALKRWWSENGKSLIGGIVLGLALIFGYRGWNEHQANQAIHASAEYERLQSTIQRGDLVAAEKQLEIINKEYSNTNYDFFASLDLAKTYVNEGDFNAAKSQLENAVANVSDLGLKQLAESRLARVLLALDEVDAAQEIVNNAKKGAFAGEFAHIEADIHRSKGNVDEAKTAYRKALDNNASNKAFIEMKFNEVN